MRARTILALFLAVVVGLPSFLLGAPTIARASSGLDLVRDSVPSNAPGQTDVGHDFYFVLPIDAQQITPTDWITIDMPHFTSLHGSPGIIGGFGTPAFTLSGTKLKITNISLLPGTGLEVFGLVADNPPISQSQLETIKISDDSAGVNVRNSAATTPIASGGYVSVSATIETLLSAISISGFTGPNAFVIMTENAAVVGTTTASGTGGFTFAISGLTPGSHLFNITSTDAQQLTTSSASVTLFLIAGNLTTYTGLLLSPTISIDKTAIDPGEAITVSGSAKPSSQVNIFLQSPLRSYLVNSAVNGSWTFTISTSETASLTPGQYQVYTIVQDGIGNQSIASPTVNFTVKTPDSSNPPPACNISHGDLNCNGVTNLTDFSILLFHWQTNHKVADINGDTHVNLTDFSIMMFYFVH